MVFSLFGCILALQCFASEFKELNGKLYVSPGSVYVASEAIYINMNGNFVPVKGISSDENGIYAEEFIAGRATYCLRCNRWWDSTTDSPFCPHKPK